MKTRVSEMLSLGTTFSLSIHGGAIKHGVILYLIATICVFATAPLSSQTKWFTYEGNAVLPVGPQGAWDGSAARSTASWRHTLLDNSRGGEFRDLYHLVSSVASNSPMIAHTYGEHGMA